MRSKENLGPRAPRARRKENLGSRAPRARRSVRRDELWEQAADISRAGLRTRRERIIAGARPILHTSLAAALAWLLATELFGHNEPFFAPISAVVTLGLTVGARRRRAVELAIGVAVGIAIADLLVAAIGTGTWQIAVITALAMAGATLVGGGALLASQAGASAVLVATLQPPDGAFDFNRFFDALIGSGVAIAVSSLILPVNPLRLVHEYVQPVLTRLVAALNQIALALETRKPDDADDALLAVGRLDVAHDEFVEALGAAGDAARLSPRRRRALSGIDRYAVAGGELGLAIENLRALARGAARAITLEDAVPNEAVEAVRELTESARALDAYLQGGGSEAARSAAVRAAGLANAVLEETSNLSALHIVGQIRLAAVDLLRATGVTRAEAQELVRTAHRG